MTTSAPRHSIIDTRRQQMFPTLEPAEIERVRQFGVVRSYGVGEALERVGEVGPGLTIIQGRSTSPSTMRRAVVSRSSRMAPVLSSENWLNWRVGQH
jgi:hypothetical protein